jgi:methenyltetrahydromethanopterin cyclohydrolase
MQLNERAQRLVNSLEQQSAELRIGASRSGCGARLIDAGSAVPGGLEAGLRLAEICLAGLGRVRLENGPVDLWPGPWVSVHTDHPLLACLAAQYAGWALSHGKYFAMGSGPMRAARGREEIFEHLRYRESPAHAVGVLETRKLPPGELCEQIARECGVPAAELTLLVAPTASLAGTLQVVARSVETCLHKLHELGGPLDQVVSGWGRAPLPPVAKDDLAAIGRTNDAILYGAEVLLWVRGADEAWAALGPKIPSSSSADHGRPFGELFAHYGHDFYKIDKLLFSPAVVTLCNLDTGTTRRYGTPAPELVRASFGLV